MIPKIIHLCWLSGDPYPEKIQKCLESWKKYLPDYEIMLWDTSRFDVNLSNWTRQAFEKKKYAFVSDYVRFYSLYNYGGIYLDSDVEVLKSFDSLLSESFFFGYEYTAVPEAAVVGAEKGLPWVKTCLDWYSNNDFINKNGNERHIVAPLILKMGVEKTLNIRLLDVESIVYTCNGAIYPADYFSAKNGYTGEIIANDKTYSIHHFNSAWLKKDISIRLRRMVHIMLIRICGKRKYNKYIYYIRKILGKY